MSRALAHALVTGGGRGIGAAIAQRLAADGMRVTVLGRSAASVEALAALDPEAFCAVTADISDGEQVARAFAQARARFGPIQVLVNNAGQAVSAPFMKTDAALWRTMLDVNLNGTMICTQEVLPEMLQAGWGRIINVASTAALKGYAYVSAYCAAKHGVLGLTRALALELATKGITVNAVCPGYTETDIVRDGIERAVARTGRAPADIHAEFVKSNPQGRLVQPEEVAASVAWLCAQSSSSITGQAISVSGGEVM